MKIGRLKIKASRWPWQKNQAVQFGRFGGGWRYRLGVSIGSTTVLIDLIFGTISFSIEK